MSATDLLVLLEALDLDLSALETPNCTNLNRCSLKKRFLRRPLAWVNVCRAKLTD